MFEDKIAAGIAWLDELDENSGYTDGELWFQVIDLKKLHLDNACNCVLGQLEGHILGDVDPYVGTSFWHIVKHSLHLKEEASRLLTWDEAIEKGFALTDYKMMEDMSNYSELTKEWKAAIKAHRDEWKVWQDGRIQSS